MEGPEWYRLLVGLDFRRVFLNVSLLSNTTVGKRFVILQLEEKILGKPLHLGFFFCSGVFIGLIMFVSAFRISVLGKENAEVQPSIANTQPDFRRSIAALVKIPIFLEYQDFYSVEKV